MCLFTDRIDAELEDSWNVIRVVVPLYMCYTVSSIGLVRMTAQLSESPWEILRIPSSDISVNEQREEDPQSSKKTALIIVTGWVSRLNSSFILEESRRSHSYQLQADKQLKLESYLGKEVEISGAETTPMTTSSPRVSTANPIAIDIHSIKDLQSRCSAY